jgi:hypothetical protein
MVDRNTTDELAVESRPDRPIKPLRLTEKTKVSSASLPQYFQLLPSLSPFHLPTTTRGRGGIVHVERLEEVDLPTGRPGDNISRSSLSS